MSERPHIEEGPSCPGCGLPNYSGLCPVCRGDEQGYVQELQFAFGPWHRATDISANATLDDAMTSLSDSFRRAAGEGDT